MSDSRPRFPIGESLEHALLKDAQTYVYKKTEQGELKVHFFFPENHWLVKPQPCVVFFHGGLWDKSMVSQFVPQCKHFIQRGAVTATVEYRVFNKHQTSPLEAIQDAQSAILWLKTFHKDVSINPEQIIAAGACSGAFIALCSAMHETVLHNEHFDARPAALLLFSSLIDLSGRDASLFGFSDKKEARALSPVSHLRKHLPPALFFHGKEDRVCVYKRVEKFAERYKKKSKRSQFNPYEHAGHSFFNFNVSVEYFLHSMQCADTFLTKLGFLSAD